MRLRLRLSFSIAAIGLIVASPALAHGGHHAQAVRRAGAKPHTRHRVVRKRRHKKHRSSGRLGRAATISLAPKVTAAAANQITPTDATLNGSINPNGADTTYTFQYGTSTSYGTRIAWQDVGSGTSDVSVKTSVSNLTPYTTYHYQIIAKNTHGTTYGTDTAVTTAKLPPSASTTPATGLSAPAATLNGLLNPNATATSYHFQFGQSSSYGFSTASQSAGSGTSVVSESAAVGGLQASSTYHFRLVASNPSGTSYGSDQTFSTPVAAPYDQLVLADHPAAYYAMKGTTLESDLTGHGHTGVYRGGAPGGAVLPDGEAAADFNTGDSHSGQYLTIPSSSVFSIPTAHQLTWEAWIRPDVLQFANPTSSDQYVDWMGKCESYSPSCEWEARMYSQQTPQGRPNRLSSYAFNPTAGGGSGAYWQPASGTISAGQWLHVVAEYQTTSTPSLCNASYPGTISVWVDGVQNSFAAEKPTGCMSQYAILPAAGSSPVDVATMALDSWFQGAIGKVAIYDTLLSQAQISAHYQAMTGQAPSGNCDAICTIP